MKSLRCTGRLVGDDGSVRGYKCLELEGFGIGRTGRPDQFAVQAEWIFLEGNRCLAFGFAYFPAFFGFNAAWFQAFGPAATGLSDGLWSASTITISPSWIT